MQLLQTLQFTLDRMSEITVQLNDTRKDLSFVELTANLRRSEEEHREMSLEDLLLADEEAAEDIEALPIAHYEEGFDINDFDFSLATTRQKEPVPILQQLKKRAKKISDGLEAKRMEEEAKLRGYQPRDDLVETKDPAVILRNYSRMSNYAQWLFNYRRLRVIQRKVRRLAERVLRLPAKH